MNKRLWILPLALVAVIGLFAGCDTVWNDKGPLGGTPGEGCSAPAKFDVVADGHTDAGDILVWNNNDKVLVQITTTAPWSMTESRLAWANTSGELPSENPDQLAPRRFQYNVSHDPAVTEYLYEIPLGGRQPGNFIAIAFNCALTSDDREDVGWGGSWEGCLTYVVRAVDSAIVRLPSYPVRMRTFHPWIDSNAFFKVELDSINEPGYSVWNGLWKGWCSEIDVEMPSDSWMTVTLLWSEDAGLPDRARVSSLGITRRWDRANWLLNHRPDSANYYHIQSAMYYLLGETVTMPGGIAGQMVQDAITYGSGFRASPGDWVAVIAITPEDVQLCFIEVICEEDEDKVVRLPTYPIRARAWHPWMIENAFWKVQLDGITEPGYNVWNGYWRGWCSELEVELPSNTWFTATLISSQAPSLPERARVSELGITRRWDCVNWLLNNKPGYVNYYHIQSAMYYLLGEKAVMPGGYAGEMAQDAITYGTGFRSQAGDWVAVILLTPPNFQLCFIEVDP